MHFHEGGNSIKFVCYPTTLNGKTLLPVRVNSFLLGRYSFKKKIHTHIANRTS